MITPFKPADWLGYLDPYYRFLNVFHHYVDLDCFVVPQDKTSHWMALNRSRRLLGVVDLQHWHASPAERVAYNDDAFKKVAKTLKPWIGSMGGFSDLFTPVVEKGKCRAVIVTGPFASGELSAAAIRRIFARTGAKADAVYGEDLRGFARILLKTPVLEGRLLRDFVRLHELFASVMAGLSGGQEAAAEMEALLNGSISKNFFHFHWAHRAVRQDRYFQAQWGSGSVMEWERREIGIERIPDRVTAILPLRVRSLNEPLEEMIVASRTQRAVLRFAVSKGGLAAGALEDDAVLLFSSDEKGRSENENRARHRDLLSQLQTSLRAHPGTDVAAGVGPRRDKHRLFQSYRGAMEALYQGLAQGKAVTFQSEEEAAAPAATGLLGLRKAASDLVESLAGGRRGASSGLREVFLAMVLKRSGGSLDAARAHLQQALTALIEAALERGRLSAEAAREMDAAFELSLQNCGGARELAAAFEDRLNEVGAALEAPRIQDKARRVAGARQWMERNFHKGLTLGEVAREHGFATSTFSREFQKAVGKPFSRALSELRLEQARNLLEGGGLSAAQVASACGIGSLSYFFQWYKRESGESPGHTRRRQSGLHS